MSKMLSSPKSPPRTLYRGLPGTGVYTWFPFVIRLDARLRFAGIPYRVEAGIPPQHTPKGKVPYIFIPEPNIHEDGSNHSPPLMGDSTMITKTLIERGLVGDLNNKLSATRYESPGIIGGEVFLRGIYEKWVLNYYTMRDVLGSLPWPVRVVVGLMIYRKVTRNLLRQGTMLFSTEEINSFDREIWESTDAVLVEARSRYVERAREGPFWVWGGDEPTEADAVLFGFIVSGLVSYTAPNMQRTVRGFPALVDYARRIHDRYLPDYVLWSDPEGLY